ncbi:hypothetical protein BJQ90_03177 [Arthrobacter sp. SO3]|nr:hypothetical protein [Arthrobacter sp. SO3]
MAGVPGFADSGSGHRACPVHNAQPASAGRRAERGRSDGDHHGLRQHDPGGPGSAVPRGRGNRAEVPGVAALERRGDGAPGAAGRYRRRRAHLHLCRGRDTLRGRVQPLLPRQGPPRRRGPGLLPGPRLPRHVCPGLHGGPALRGGPGRVPAGEVQGRTCPLLLPAPAADAGVLGVPHGLDGHRADERDLPGPVQPVPGQPRHQGHLRPAGLGVFG